MIKPLKWCSHIFLMTAKYSQNNTHEKVKYGKKLDFYHNKEDSGLLSLARKDYSSCDHEPTMRKFLPPS